MDEPRSKVVRCVVDPVLFTIGINAVVLLAKLDVSGSQLSIEPSLSPLSGVALFQRRRAGISRATDGLRIDDGLFTTGYWFVSSSTRLRVASIGGPAIGLSLISSLSGAWFFPWGFCIGGTMFGALNTRGTPRFGLWLLFSLLFRGRRIVCFIRRSRSRGGRSCSTPSDV